MSLYYLATVESTIDVPIVLSVVACICGYSILLISDLCVLCSVVFSASVSAEKNASGNSVGGECESNYQKHAKLSVNKDESDKASADAAAASADEGKDARRGSDTIGSRGWLPDWNLSSLTQLTGSVKNTVNTTVFIFINIVVMMILTDQRCQDSYDANMHEVARQSRCSDVGLTTCCHEFSSSHDTAQLFLR